MELVLKNLKSILISLFFIAFAIIVYLNSSKIVSWFKSLFTNISKSDVPTDKDLKDPTYNINDKIIDNYVEQIIVATNMFGVDEQALDKVYKNLKATSIQNVIDVWNNFKNRKLKYSLLSKHYESGLILGDDYSLYTVLKDKLSKGNQSEKNAWINWDNLLRKKAHLY